MSVGSFPLPDGGFFQAIVTVNGLEEGLGRGRLLFFPGMCFASPRKWWGRGGMREQTHEGLDICFFEDAQGNRLRLDENIRIPAAFDGHLAAVIPDFLGSTVIVAHRSDDHGPPFYILYAHVCPDADLEPGQRLPAGRTFAAIAPPRAKLLPPHLHLSLMRAECMPAIESLDWPLLNRLERDRFSDPIEIIGGAWQMMDFIPGVDLYEAFAPCGQLSSLYAS